MWWERAMQSGYSPQAMLRRMGMCKRLLVREAVLATAPAAKGVSGEKEEEATSRREL